MTNADWQKKIADKNQKMFFAFDGKKLIGMFGVNFFTQEKLNHRAKAKAFYVAKEYQGQGVGSRLMEAVVAYVQTKKHIVKIDSSVNVGQEASLRVHLKCGFKKIGLAHKEMKVGKKFYDQHVLEKLMRGSV